MKKIITTLLVVLVGFSLTACTAGDKGADIALITDVGTIDDGSFNQGSYEGVKQYGDEHDVTYDYYRPAIEDDEAYYDEISKAIKDGGAKVVVTPGFLFEKAVYRAQNDFPDVHFVFLDGAPKDNDGNEAIGDNTYSVLYEEHQAGFLAGYAAVHEGFEKLGFIGGMKVPAVERFGIGFVKGADVAAKELNKKIEMHFNYADAFVPTPEVQALAAGWYASGTEVIFSAAGGANNSVFAAAEAAEAKTIGVDVDQYDVSETVVTSAMKELQLSVYEALTLHFDDKFPGGTQYTYSVKDNGVGLSHKFDRFENFTEEQYKAIYKRLVDNEEGLLESIPRTHEADFSDHTFENIELILN